MRIRSIVPAFWSSLTLAQVPRDLRLFFVGLWSCADDHGRGLADPRWLKGQLFAFDDDVTAALIESWLTRLAGVGVIICYEGTKGQPLYQVNSWKEHQHPQKPKPSKFPAPTLAVAVEVPVQDASDTGKGQVPEASGDRPPAPRERYREEGSGQEGRGEGEKSLKGTSLPREKRAREGASR